MPATRTIRRGICHPQGHAAPVLQIPTRDTMQQALIHESATRRRFCRYLHGQCSGPSLQNRSKAEPESGARRGPESGAPGPVELGARASHFPWPRASASFHRPAGHPRGDCSVPRGPDGVGVPRGRHPAEIHSPGRWFTRTCTARCFRAHVGHRLIVHGPARKPDLQPCSVREQGLDHLGVGISHPQTLLGLTGASLRAQIARQGPRPAG